MTLSLGSPIPKGRCSTEYLRQSTAKAYSTDMEKMTPKSLESAIKRIAGQANAPHTPPHLLQESDDTLSESDEANVRRVINNKMKTAIPELDDVVNILLRMDKSHRIVNTQDFQTLKTVLKQLPDIKVRLNKSA